MWVTKSTVDVSYSLAVSFPPLIDRASNVLGGQYSWLGRVDVLLSECNLQRNSPLVRLILCVDVLTPSSCFELVSFCPLFLPPEEY